jgi:hypothetical protein
MVLSRALLLRLGVPSVRCAKKIDARRTRQRREAPSRAALCAERNLIISIDLIAGSLDRKC